MTQSVSPKAITLLLIMAVASPSLLGGCGGDKPSTGASVVADNPVEAQKQSDAMQGNYKNMKTDHGRNANPNASRRR